MIVDDVDCAERSLQLLINASKPDFPQPQDSIIQAALGTPALQWAHGTCIEHTATALQPAMEREREAGDMRHITSDTNRQTDHLRTPSRHAPPDATPPRICNLPPIGSQEFDRHIAHWAALWQPTHPTASSPSPLDVGQVAPDATPSTWFSSVQRRCGKLQSQIERCDWHRIRQCHVNDDPSLNAPDSDRAYHLLLRVLRW